MKTSDNIGFLNFSIKNKHYLLTKTELHCQDKTQPKNNFSIALNAIDPNYSYYNSYSLFYILLAVYFMAGVIIHFTQWFTGSPRFDTLANFQLMLFSGFLILGAFRFYKTYKEKNAFKFYYLHEDKIAFSIPKLRKNTENTQVFLEALVDNIDKATLSSRQVLYLLGYYELLTKTEWMRLDTQIMDYEMVKSTQKSKVHHLTSESA